MLVQELGWKKTHSSMKAFLPDPDDVTRDLNKLHIKVLYNLYSCLDIIHVSGVIKPKRINGRRMWHVWGGSGGPATGHLDTGFSWFPCVYKQMLRRFPTLQVATTCFSCSPPDLNLLVTNFIFCTCVK